MRVLRVLIATVVAIICFLPLWSAAQTCSDPPQINVVIFKPCPNGSNGSVTITHTGGHAIGGGTLTDTDDNTVYNLSLSGSNWTTGPNVLSAGTYALALTYEDDDNNANACTQNYTNVVVTEYDPILVSTSATTSACFGTDITLSGSVTSGGAGPLTYVWTNPGNTVIPGGNLNDVEPANNGTYTLTVTDSVGCTGQSTTALTVSTAIVADAEYDSTYCHGATVALAGSATGGSGVYTYAWTGPASYSSTNANNDIVNATAANSGVYSLVVTDDDNCVSNTATTTVTVTTPVVAAAQADDAYCHNANITLSASASGGTSSYTYTWATESGDAIAGGQIANATVADNGKYVVTAQDANGCTDTDTTEITVLTAVAVTVPQDSTYCYGVTFSLNASAAGGSGTYSSYSWAGPGGYTSTQQNAQITTPDANDAGAYTLTVTDNEGCTGTASTTVAIATPVVADAEYDSTYCHGATIALAGSATGGSGTYTYAWSGPASFSSTDANADITNATAANSGTYSLVVTDDNSCVSVTTTAAVVVTTPVVVTAQNDNTYCNDATITLGATSSGGTANYTYTWTSPGDDPVAGGQIANATSADNGNYVVLATDANGCTDTDTTNITVSPAIVVSAGTDSTYCFASTITLASTVSGGTGTYTTYAWTGPNSFSSNQANPQVTTSAAAVHAGTYNLVVTDNMGCMSGSAAVVINVNTAIVANALYDSSYCYGATIALAGDASGGTGTYTYAWSGPASYSSADQNAEIMNATPANSGQYTLTVTDDAGCVGAPDAVTVTVHPQVAVVAGNDTTYCHNATVTLTASASNGTAPYTYTWVNASEDPVANGVVADATAADNGAYVVTATDANGCTAVDTTSITVLTPVVAVAMDDTAYCAGAAITLTSHGEGGSGTYSSYAWYGPNSYTSTSQNPQIASASSANVGAYNLVIKDNLGCTSDTEVVNIAVYDPFVITASNNGLCHGIDATLSYTTVSGGQGDLAFSWTGPNGYTSADENPVLVGATANNNGVYGLTITDEKGCVSNTATTTVTVTDSIIVTALSNNASCPGAAITFSASATGGTSPYTYNWSNADSDPVSGGVLNNPTLDAAGVYSLMVSDANGCESVVYNDTVTFYETPTTEASNFQVLTISSDSLVVSFDRGTGEGVVVLVSEGAVANAQPSCGAVYNAQTDTVVSFGQAGLSSLGNAKIVYNSYETSSTVQLTVTGLDFNTQYHFTVYEYDTSVNGISYLLDPNLVGDEVTSHAPTGLASNLRYENVDHTSLTAKWNNGNGQGRIVVLQLNDSFLTGGVPVDGVEYTAHMTPGMGDSLGTGIYVIYNGTGDSLDITGLTKFGLYTVGVYEYNGTGSNIKYSLTATERAVRTSATVIDLVSKYTIRYNFTNPGNDKGILVLAKQGSPITGVPVNGTDYNTSTQKHISFNTSTLPQVGDAYAVYKNRNRDGEGNPAIYTMSLLDLTSDERYYLQVYEWDTLTNTYTHRPELAIDTMTLLGAPNTPSKNLRVDNITANSLTLRWTNGNGARRIVVMKVKTGSNIVTAVTEDSTTYIANTIFGMGDTLAGNNPGTNYVVYNGSDSSVTITGLTTLTTYNLAVIDYNGDDGFENYRTTSYNKVDATTSGIKLTNVTPKKATITFAHGGGKGAVVLIKEGSPITTDPTNGVDYAAPTFLSNSPSAQNVSLNNTTLPVIDGAKMIYRHPKAAPAIKAVTINDLKAATKYYIAAYEWDSVTNTYYPATKLTIDTTSGLAAPTTVAKNITVENITTTSMKVKWTAGSGANRIVVMKAGANLNGVVQNNTTYDADSVFGMGDTLALQSGATNVSGNYVVYNGNDSSVTVTNLLPNTVYYVRIYEYNGDAVNMYGTGSGVVNRRTLADFVTMKKEGQPYVQDFDSFAVQTVLPVGWHSSDATITANTGSDGTAGVHHFGGGNYSSANRSLGSIGNNTFGVKIRNSSTKTITSLLVRYRGIQWRKGGASTSGTPDQLKVQYSMNAYTLTDPNQYMSSTPATWTDATDNTWNSNTNINFYSLTTGAGAASLNVAGSLPTQLRGASITGLSLAPGQTIWIRFNDLDLAGGDDDALAIDSFEAVMFSNTIMGGSTVASGSMSDLNIVGGTVTQVPSSVSVVNGMNIENDATYNMAGTAARTLKVGGRLYTDNDLGRGVFATGALSSINIAGDEGVNNLNFSASSNTMRNLSITAGATATINSALNIVGGNQYGTVAVGTSAANSVLNTNGLLTLKSDTVGTATISQIYGSVNGSVTVERAFTYKAGNRLMGHPLSSDISISQVNDDVAVDVSNTTSQNVWSFSPTSTTATQASHLVNSTAWRAYTSATGDWDTREVLRLAKGAGASTLDVTGTINQGHLPIGLSGNVGSLAIVTNPYPAAIKLSTVLSGATGIVDTIWIYNLSSNTFTASPASSWGGLNLPMFGVFVVKLSATNATLTFNEANKITKATTSTFFRPEDGIVVDDEGEVPGGDLGTVTEKLEVSLAPNPADDVLTIRMNSEEDSKAIIRVLSMTGQVMITEEVESTQHSHLVLPVGNLATGVYIVEVTTATEKITKQLMKL